MTTKKPMLSYVDLLNGIKKQEVASEPFKACTIGEVIDVLEKQKFEAFKTSEPDPTSDDDDSHIESCPVDNCKGLMEKYYNEFHLVCGKCGYAKQIGNIGEHNISAGESHNISSNAYMYFKATGSKNRIYSNAMVKYTSEHGVHRENDIRQRFKEVNYRNGNPIPPNVIGEAADLFIVLKSKDYVRRGCNLKGVEGACVYVKCQEAGITKSKAEIAGYYRIEESLISFGCAELKTFESRGFIELPQNKDPTTDYVNAVFEIFNIPERYHQFVVDVLERIESKRIIEISSCFTMTKVIGVVYLLSILEGLNIDHDCIASKYNKNISQSTYKNVYKTILKNATKLIKPFTKHNIKLPYEWRDIKIKTSKPKTKKKAESKHDDLSAVDSS